MGVILARTYKTILKLSFFHTHAFVSVPRLPSTLILLCAVLQHDAY